MRSDKQCPPNRGPRPSRPQRPSTVTSKSITSTNRAQTNLDFSIALLIIAGFLSTTVFFGGSFIYNINQNELDYSLEAQQSLDTLEQQLQSGDPNYIDQAEFRTLTQLSDIDSYLRLGEGLNGNLTFTPVDASDPPSVFQDSSKLYAGKTIPNTVTSTASTIIRIDNREVRVTLSLWGGT